MFAKTSKAPVTAVVRACPSCGSLDPSHACPAKQAPPPAANPTAPRGK